MQTFKEFLNESWDEWAANLRKSKKQYPSKEGIGQGKPSPNKGKKIKNSKPNFVNANKPKKKETVK